MKQTIALFLAKLIWRWISGQWVDVSGFKVEERDPLLRPIDQSIKQVFDTLDKWDHPQRKEIICAIINKEWPGKHIHSNPVKRKAA